MNKLIRIAIVDDHLVTRKGIISLLQHNEDLEVVAEGHAGNHVLELLETHKPDVLITDLQMPAHENNPKGVLFEPVSTLKKAVGLFNSTAIIVFSQEHDIQTIQSLAYVGVKGYLLKTDDFSGTLSQVVEMVHAGKMYFSPEVQQIIISAPRLKNNQHLTAQQMNVLRAVMRSPTATRIELAGSLSISPSTLQKHINAIFAALDVPNMESCFLKAMRMRLVDVDAVLGGEK
jgi:DNA-binding NarL/FixJ family response regulator